MHRLLDALWYGPAWRAWPLSPLSALFRGVAGVRRALYRSGVFRVHRFPVPVVVVGNLTVGGTGKSPLVVRLAALLAEHGWRPGIVVRGYRGGAEEWPRRVTGESDPAEVGDEAVLLARRCRCPVVAGPERAADVRLLLGDGARRPDVVLCDDGLQHYALARDIELVVVDGRRGWGNGHCLPAGPLREPLRRLREVDFVLVNGPGQAPPHGHRMQLVQGDAVSLAGHTRRPLRTFAGETVHAVAGIGNPQRFFDQLAEAGLEVIPHAFPDHYAYRPADVRFSDGRVVVMTEKDAVKCTGFAGGEHWYVPVEAILGSEVEAALLERLEQARTPAGGRGA
ncbi:MAG TPA: tetraacyldisaccharide 4'-kinase [Gammaproteobacteria bacterium]|nr:tetraacyldisaccharide 4'-kinase [Gammaproteobacteria bacterium]